MTKWILVLTAVLFLFPLSGTTLAGIPGTPDRVPAATLVVPFFEVDQSGVQDTLLVVTNTYDSDDDLVHYEVWDRDGNRSGIYGNFTLGPSATWAKSMSALISEASASSKSQLEVGNFYQGFVTFDVVEYYTALPPIDKDYPFKYYNDLEGYIYYTRLPEGSSNGLNMIPIEYVDHQGTSLPSVLRDFYQNDDGREEIASDARLCAEALIYGDPCPDSYDFSAIDSRVFLQPNLSAESRIILFSWTPYEVGGPSVICDNWGDCPTTYPYIRYDEEGNVEEDTTITLDHVVNVINVSGTENGWVRIQGVPSGWIDGQTYAFSFNSASPPSESTNWDAIFESNMYPGYGMPVLPAGAGRRVPRVLK